MFHTDEPALARENHGLGEAQKVISGTLVAEIRPVSRRLLEADRRDSSTGAPAEGTRRRRSSPGLFLLPDPPRDLNRPLDRRGLRRFSCLT